MNKNILSVESESSFGMLLLLSLGLFCLGGVINETLRWSNVLHGFLNGICHVFILGIVWIIYVVPWSILIFFLYRWKKWKKYRTYLMVFPSVLALLYFLGSLVAEPPTAKGRFKRHAKTDLPEDLKNLETFFSGGGLTDFHDEYYFETSRDEVLKLISDMNLTIGGGYINAAEIEGCFLSKQKRIPPKELWEDSKVFARNNRDTGWYYELRVDKTKTKVYIRIGCI